MKKLRTQFKNFAYQSFIVKNPVVVEWFYFNSEDEETRGFEAEELKVFQQYTTSNIVNFPENHKDVFITDEHDLPYLDYLYFVPENRFVRPKYVILTSKPIESNGYSTVMYVKLLNVNGFDQKNYSLDFTVIGRIISWQV